MKHLLHKLSSLRLLTLLAVLLGIGSSTAWADTSTLTFTAKCNGSGTADDGASWTVASDGTESIFDDTKGIHYGTSSAQVKYITLTTSGISGTISQIVVNASAASGVSASLNVTVGGSSFGTQGQSVSSSATNYTFTGSASGEIVVTLTKPSKAAKALYVKSIAVTYTSGGGSQVATPTFSLAGGAVPYNSEITLSCETEGATIYYTTNNSTPTASSTEYDPENKPKVTGTVTIKAIAIDETGDLSDSEVASADYTVAAPETPTFSPAAGSVYYGTKITLSSDAGTTIYYTTNGDTPGNTSTEYDPENKPTITADGTIKAIAYDAGGNPSLIGSAAYTLKAPAAPVFSLDAGMVSKGASLTLSAEEGTTIRYTTDGSTEPTASVGTVYTSAITINAAQTIKAVAYDGAGTCSDVATKAYTVFVGDVVTFDATSDTGSSLDKNGVSFTTSVTENGVFKFYKNSSTTFSATNGKIKKIEFTGVSSYAISNMTANTGTLDTSSSPNGVWTGSVTSVTFKASNGQTRASLIKVYVAKTASPTFSVAGGEYSEAKSVELASDTDGATIYYTTNGDTPTSGSTAYSSAISVTETQTIKAIAIYDGVESAVSSATYTMNRPAVPTFDVAEGVFDEAFDLHLSTETADATIYYTTNGSTPTTGSSEYSTKVAISAATTTVKAIAVKDGLTSDVSSATYTYDSRTTPTFSLSSYAVDLNVNVEGSVTLTTNHDGSITATSSDGTHMPISYNSSTKVCTFTASQAGDYTVTFSATGSDNYKNAEAVVNVSVTKKATTMAIETLFEDGKDLKTASEGLIEGTVKYNDVALSPQPTITYTSGTTSVATVDEDGIITFVKAGSTTITVAFAGNDEYEACQNTYELNLIDTTPQDVEVEIALNSTTLGSTTPNGKTATVKNVSVTTNKGSSAIDLVANTAHVRMYKYSNMVIVAPMGYVIKNITFTEPSSDKTWNDSPTASTGTYSSKSWTGSANSVTFTFDAGQCRIASITVTLAETVTISSARFTTYVAKHDISFPAGVTAYIVTPKDATSVTLTAKASVPEGTAVVLEGDAGTYALPTIETEPEDVTGNKLQASTGSTVGDGSTIYSLGNKSNGVGFYLVGNGVKVPAGKAYLIVGEGSSLSVKEFLSFDFEDVPTGLNDVRSKMEDVSGEIFNLAGQKMNRLQKGINIVNGRKVLVK